MGTFRCPRCGAVSYHPQDKEFGYCGRCHDFTAAPVVDPLDVELFGGLDGPFFPEGDARHGG